MEQFKIYVIDMWEREIAEFDYENEAEKHVEEFVADGGDIDYLYIFKARPMELKFRIV